MKKLLVLLIAAALCLCVVGCVEKPEQMEPADSKPEATNGTAQTTVPGDPTQNTTSEQTDGEFQGQIQPPTPDEMPDAPTADYSLPGDERPGDRITEVPNS